MKIWIGMLLLGTALLFSCEANEYPDLIYTPDNVESINKEVRGTIAITPTLNYNTLFFLSASRGSGAFDHDHYLEEFEEHYLNAKFYLLAYRRTAHAGEMSVPTDLTQLMNFNTNPDKRDCLISTEKMALGPQDHRGKLVKPIDFTGALQFVDDETGTKTVDYFWNEVYGTTGYDFFGYYVDDAVIQSTNVAENKTSMNVTIDGTQDLMVGAAPEVTLDLLKSRYPGVIEQETKDKIIAYGEGAYSTYGGGHSVQPKIDMKHCLSRVMVYCKQMDGLAKIKVKEVRLKAKTNGVMTVAARNMNDVGFVATGNQSWINLPNVQVPLVYGQDVLLGPGIMVPEEDTYDLELVFDETYYLDEGETLTETKTTVYPILLKMDNDTFKAGTAYYIKLTMFGATRVEVDVEVGNNWQDGGTIDVGTQD